MCNGTEDKLMQCQHYGFAKLLPSACYDEPWRLHIIAQRSRPILAFPYPDENCRPPKILLQFFSARRLTYSEAEQFCASIQNIEIDSVPSDKRPAIASINEVANVRYIDARKQPPNFIQKLWLANHTYYDGKEKISHDPNEKMPVVCTVYVKC